MFTTITTKFMSATNSKGARVKASATLNWDEAVTLNWDHAMTASANHVAAAQALAKKLGWDGTWYGGDAGYRERVFVRVLHDYPNHNTSFVVDRAHLSGC